MTDPRVYMDARLRPNRSLSPPAFAWVMGIVAGASLACGLFFLSMGAWPVFGFFGLDAVGLWLALRWHRRRSAEETRVVVTADDVALFHRDPRGREREARLPTAFARVELDTPVRPNTWLRIEHGRRAVIIGRFLTPRERCSFADALRDALRVARQERHTA